MQGEQHVIPIGEHEFITPPEPKKKDILYHDQKKENQYWRRQTDLPKIFYDWHYDRMTGESKVELDAKDTRYDNGILMQLSREDTKILLSFQGRELLRRSEGIWMFNNDKPTYLTGNHYFSLQWGPMRGCTNYIEPNSQYGQYYRFQRDTFYYLEICKTTPIARGGLVAKSKKTGLTQIISLACLNEGSLLREKNIRMMNITETLARESNFGLIRYAIQKMPMIMLPTMSKINEGEVIFGPANSSRNMLRKAVDINSQPLNTWICTVPTGKTSFDSFTNYFAIIDEWLKIKENTYPQELFDVTIETVREGVASGRKGTVFAMCYAPEHTDRSFREGRTLYKNSKLSTRRQDEQGKYYGETASHLLCWLLPVQDGIFGGCDKYGDPIPHKIWDIINEEIANAKGDPQKIQNIKRQYPTSESDVWSEAMREDTLFDNIRLDRKLQKLESDASNGILPYEEFDLEYDFNPKKQALGEEYDFPKVIHYRPVTHEMFMKGTKGTFKWYRREWTPEWFLQRHLNKAFYNKKTNRRMPDPNSPFFISIDPTNYRQKKYTAQGSMNSMQAFIMPSSEVNGACAENTTNFRLMIEYYYRRENPIDTLHDFIKLMLFLNCMVQIESNVTTWAEDIIKMGLGHFLLMVNDNGALEPWTGYDNQRFFSSQATTIPQYVMDGKKHLGEPRLPDDLDNITYLDSARVIEQLMAIKMEDTKEYDAAVAYLEGIMGMYAWAGWKKLKAERGGGKSNVGIMAAAKLAR